MRFLTDERAQAIQVGAVLIFGIIVLFLSIYQAFVVPDQNEEIEFNHNEDVQQQLTELRSNVILMPGSTSTRAASVDLGVRYPSRAIFVNPGPASGSLRTVGTEDPRVNVTIANATAVDTEGETGDFWNGTALSYETGALRYRPNYNLYQQAPQTVYEHSVLYNRFDRENVTQAVTDQTLVDGNRITLLALNGSLGESRVDTVSVDFDPISTRTRVVEVNDTGGPVTLRAPTGMSQREWNSVLGDELVANGGHVQNVTVSGSGPADLSMLEITLEANERYQLELVKVGVGTGTTGTTEAYLTDVEGNNATVRQGESRTLVVEARNKFNGPRSGVTVRASAEGGSFDDGATKTTDNQGRATFDYQATAAGTNRINVTIDPGYDPDSRHDGTSPTNVTMQVTVQPPPSSGGSGGSAYNVSWQDPSAGEPAVTYDPAADRYDYNASQTSALELTMGTDPVADGARVEYAVSNRSVGTLSRTVGTTDSAGRNSTTFEPGRTGEVTVYTASGGDGDRLTLNVTSAPTGNLTIDPDTENVASVHNWSFRDVPFEGEVDTITADYSASGASFDGLDQDDITVYITRSGDSEPTEISVNNDNYNGSVAPFDLSGVSDTDIDGPVWVEIDGIENPPAGAHEATLTFDGSADSYSATKSFETVGAEPFFNVTITGTNSPVTEGETLEVDVNVTNTGDNPDTQTLNLTDTGFTSAEQDTVDVSLAPGASNNSITLEWSTSDGDAGTGNVTVFSENTSDAAAVTVQEPPFFDVEITGTNSPVTETDTLTVDVNVTNTGGVQDTQTLNLTDTEFNNAEQDTVDVTLAAGAYNNSITLEWPTSDGDTGTGNVTVFSENHSDLTEVTVEEANGLSGTSVTDIVPNAGEQMQTFTFTISGEDLPSGETVVVDLDEPQATSPIQVDYSSASVNDVKDGGSGGDASIDTNSGTGTLDYTASSGDVPAGTTVRIRVTSINAGGKPDQSDPYAIPISRTDFGVEDSAQFSVALQNGTAELEDFEVTDLVGTDTQEQTIRFTPTTEMDATGNGPEILTVDLSKAQDGTVDYSSASVQTTSTGSAGVNTDSNVASLKFEANGGVTAGTEVEITIESVNPSSTGETYETGFSRGAADTNSTTFDVQEPPFFEVREFQAPDSAPRGTTITVNATVENTGDLQDTQTIEYRFDGTAEATQTVTLNASEATTVEFSYSIPDDQATGTYTHGIFSENDSETAQIDVEESMADRTYVSGTAVDTTNAGNIEFYLGNTGGDAVEINGIVVNASTDPQATTVDNDGNREFAGADGYVNIAGGIIIGASDATPLDQTATISAGIETFSLEQFRDSNGNSRNHNNDDITVTLVFSDGSTLTFTATAS